MSTIAGGGVGGANGSRSWEWPTGHAAADDDDDDADRFGYGYLKKDRSLKRSVINRFAMSGLASCIFYSFFLKQKGHFSYFH
ncbi:GM21024 [Drosophila sechellia]|uniref:GM21024 n=1 Tax=Drosophila sechellia TaxID=7238 RepID=B4HRV0_DROSE|nr:GM21024 [Drosophila sechellia]